MMMLMRKLIGVYIVRNGEIIPHAQNGHNCERTGNTLICIILTLLFSSDSAPFCAHTHTDAKYCASIVVLSVIIVFEHLEM